MSVPRKIKAIFFDYGGTLCDYYPSNEEVWARIANRLGVPVSPDDPRIRDGIRNQVVQYERLNIPFMELSKQELHTLNSIVLSAVGIGGENAQRIIDAEFHAREQGRLYKLYPETPNTLQKIKQKGFKIGLISNTNGQDALKRRRSSMKDQGILQFFDTIILSSEVGVWKPHKEIFEIALQENGIKKPEEAMLVGDSPIEDLKGAQNAGLIPVFLDRFDWFSPENVIKIKVLSDILQYLG
jgi:HAD superfamily hydrolase (TIGR01549 family)